MSTCEIAEDREICCESGESYTADDCGVIHQLDPKPYVYDKKYLDYYEGIKERTIRLGFMRAGYILGYLQGQIEYPISSVLEVGYGSGSFLDAAKKSGIENCFGNDIKEFPLPDGCSFVSQDDLQQKRVDVLAMFDVYEHVVDLGFIESLKAEYVVLTVPRCEYNELLKYRGVDYANEWFESWRMRMPDEHRHHFDELSLYKTMDKYGYELAPNSLTYMENTIRLREGEKGPNVFTAIFKKR